MKWSSTGSAFFRLLIAGCIAASFCGCLPQDELTAIRFSPEGNMLAYVSEKYGLGVYDFSADISDTLAPQHVAATDIAWSHDSRRVAYVTDVSGNLDIAVAPIGSEATTITAALSRQSSPAYLADGSVVYLSTAEGPQQLWRMPKDATAAELFCVLPGEVISHATSPDGRFIVATISEELLPQHYLINTAVRASQKLTTETYALANLGSIIAWSPSSQRLLVSTRGIESAEKSSVRLFNIRGDAALSKQELRSVPGGVTSAVFAGEDELVCLANNNLFRWKIGRSARQLQASGFEVKNVAANTSGTRIAAVLEDQLLASFSESGANPKFHFLRWEDQVLLAEELLAKRRLSEARKLYEKIAETVQTVADPALGEVVRAANLIRFNREASAITKLETLLSTSNIPARVSESTLWRMLGFAYLQSGRNDSDARRCLTASIRAGDAAEDEEAVELTSAVLDVVGAGTAAMRLLREGLHGRDVKPWKTLLREHPTSESVQRLYLHSRDGFAALTTLYQPSANGMELTARKNITFLQDFVQVARGSDLVSQARRELLRLYLENGESEKCRTLLRELLQHSDEEIADEVAYLFQSYIEVPEQQPWLEKAMSDVLLHPSVRPLIEKEFANSRDTMHPLLHYLAATKHALVQRSTTLAHAELQRVEQTLIHDDQTSLAKPLLPLIALCYRAKCAELEGNRPEAAERCDAALAFVRENKLNDIELYLEMKFRANLLREADDEITSRLLLIEKHSGDELLKPLWDRPSLLAGIEQWAKTYAQSPQIAKPYAAYFAGIYYSSAKELPLARAALLHAAAASSPLFLREKALFELATLDEAMNDPFNAARWLSEAARLPTVGEYERDWYDYKIAENYLRLRHRTDEARDMLNRLAQSSAEWLAASAHELLATQQHQE